MPIPYSSVRHRKLEGFARTKEVTRGRCNGLRLNPSFRTYGLRNGLGRGGSTVMTILNGNRSAGTFTGWCMGKLAGLLIPMAATERLVRAGPNCPAAVPFPATGKGIRDRLTLAADARDGREGRPSLEGAQGTKGSRRGSVICQGRANSRIETPPNQMTGVQKKASPLPTRRERGRPLLASIGAKGPQEVHEILDARVEGAGDRRRRRD